MADDLANDVASDALLVTIADYPASNGLLRPLPGTARDRDRVRNWIRTHAPAMSIREVSWPAAQHQERPLYSYDIDAEMRQLRLAATQKPRDRLFVYFSSHGRSSPENSAIPVVYCASHSRGAPDEFFPVSWILLLTHLPLYKEYLFFFDCCNDWQPGPPSPMMPNVPYRQDKPSVLVGAACAPNQEALETADGGVFTDVLLEALSGSAGSKGTDVSAGDVVDYLKERVPMRAASLKPGHVQRPVFWFDAEMHADLASFPLFSRAKVSVNLSSLIGGRAATDVEVLRADLEPIGTLSPGADGAALIDAFPGKYVLRSPVDGWRQVIVVKTTVDDQGGVTPAVEVAA